MIQKSVNLPLNLLFSLLSTFIILLFPPSLFSFIEEIENEKISRSDTLPLHYPNQTKDDFLEGYLQALLDVHYSEFHVIAKVKNRDVTLYNLPKEQLMKDAIISFVSDVPGVADVRKFTLKEFIQNDPNVTTPANETIPTHPQREEQIDGTWLPQSNLLFPPFLADPRKMCYSAGLRFGDSVISQRAISVSGGEHFSIFRWKHIFPYQGDLELNLEAGIWAVFDPRSDNSEWAELVNTDFYVGIPLTYAINRWSWQFRIYHSSSHLGDEYIQSHPHVARYNPSKEAVDVIASYNPNDAWRLYCGPGIILSSDPTFKEKPAYLIYGAEYKFLGKKSTYHNLYTQPFIALHVEQGARNNWTPNITAAIGVEWLKLSKVGKKVRAFLEIHHGYSLEGQFAKKKTSYASINMSYGF